MYLPGFSYARKFRQPQSQILLHMFFFHVSGWCETLWIDSSTILNLVLLVGWVVFDWHFESFIAFWNFQHFWPYKKLFLPYILQNIDNFVINFTVSSFEISVAAAVFPPISIFINTRILYSVRSATCGLRHPFPLADAVGFCSECWANGSTARELFPRTHPLTPNTRLDSFFKWYCGPTGNRIHFTSFGDACLTNCCTT